MDPSSGGGFVEKEYTYEVVQTFYAVSGGSWSRRPAGIDTLWRLQNVQVTLGPWSLNELEFYDPWWCFRRCFWKESFGGGGWLVEVGCGWLVVVGWMEGVNLEDLVFRFRKDRQVWEVWSVFFWSVLS